MSRLFVAEIEKEKPWLSAPENWGFKTIEISNMHTPVFRTLSQPPTAYRFLHFICSSCHTFFFSLLPSGHKESIFFYVLDHCWTHPPPHPFFGHGMFLPLLFPCVGFLKRCWIRNQVSSVAGIPLYNN